MDKSLILKEIKKHYNFASDAYFARFLDIKPQTLSNWYARNTFDYEIIYTKCVDVDIDWIFTGKGEMLKKESPMKDVETINIPNGQMSLYRLKTDYYNQDKQSIPLYEIEASAGLSTLFANQHTQVPLDFITIPNAPKCDGALFVRGDSMYPLLKSGDIACYKTILDFADVRFGEMYILDIENSSDRYLTAKYLQKSELGKDYITLVSENKHHSPKDEPITNIKALALVKVTIRYNTLS